MKIRKLMQEIGNILDKKDLGKSYYILNYIVCHLEDKYNLQEEEIEKQLELILKSFE